VANFSEGARLQGRFVVEGLGVGFFLAPLLGGAGGGLKQARIANSSGDNVLVTQSSTEKTQRTTELINQFSVDLSDFSVDLSVSF